MSELISGLCLLFIVLCGFSVAVSPIMGRRMDPFFLSRPLGRWLLRLPARFCRRLSRMFNNLSGQAWRQGHRTQSLVLKISLYLVSAALGTVGMILSIPAELLGEIPRL